MVVVGMGGLLGEVVRVNTEEMKEAVRIHQRTEPTESTSPAAKKIQTLASAASRRSSVWRA